MSIMSKSQYGRHRGRSPSAVNQWIANGLIGSEALVGTGRNALIDVEVADRHLAFRLDPGQRLGNGAERREAAPAPQPAADSLASDSAPNLPDDLDPGSPDYQAQRARLVRAQAEAQEMKNALARNELATVAAVEHKIGVRNAAIRSRLLALPGRVRADIPRLTETEIKIVDTAVRAILKELVHG